VTRFDGKVALVSGAAGVIGSAVAARLAEEGAAVVACDVRVDGLDDGVACDVRDADSCRAAVDVTRERHGQLDVLVNVAGIVAGNRIEDVTPEEWRRVIDVNLTGTFLLSQAAVPSLRAARGTIVNLASAAGIQGTPYNASYCASKGGVIMLTKSLALELAADGVRVNAVCPAAVDTPFLHGFQLPEDADLQLLTRSVAPMGGLITAAEVAAAVAYLASSDAASVSGTTLVIDGAASA
jgi:meso-butanediol dehydrogenase / (S,S)-butanediol dehydrogenase / diacetyl reductase